MADKREGGSFSTQRLSDEAEAARRLAELKLKQDGKPVNPASIAVEISRASQDENAEKRHED